MDSDRDLAAALLEMHQPDRDVPVPVFRQAVITAVAAGPPRTVSVRLGGETGAAIPGVRVLDGYAPAVNDTAWCVVQGRDLWVVGKLAAGGQLPDTDWAVVTPATGWSHYAGQNTLGQSWTPRYRRHRGLVVLEGLMAGGPAGLITTLPVGFRPGTGETMRHLSTSAGIVRVDVSPSGAVTTQGVIVGASTTNWTNLACSFVAEG